MSNPVADDIIIIKIVGNWLYHLKNVFTMEINTEAEVIKPICISEK